MRRPLPPRLWLPPACRCRGGSSSICSCSPLPRRRQASSRCRRLLRRPWPCLQHRGCNYRHPSLLTWSALALAGQQRWVGHWVVAVRGMPARCSVFTPLGTHLHPRLALLLRRQPTAPLCSAMWCSAPIPSQQDEEDSPALTQNAAPHAAAAAAATADLLSPLRAQLPPAPPLFTPNSSGRWEWRAYREGVSVTGECNVQMSRPTRHYCPPALCHCRPADQLRPHHTLAQLWRRAKAHSGLPPGCVWPGAAAAGHPRRCWRRYGHQKCAWGSSPSCCFCLRLPVMTPTCDAVWFQSHTPLNRMTSAALLRCMPATDAADCSLALTPCLSADSPRAPSPVSTHPFHPQALQCDLAAARCHLSCAPPTCSPCYRARRPCKVSEQVLCSAACCSAGASLRG